MSKAIGAGVLGFLVLVTGGIALVALAVGRYGDCVPDPDQAQLNCNPPLGMVLGGIGLAVLGVVFLGVMTGVAVSRAQKAQRATRDHLLRTGIAGTARIVSVRQAGADDGDPRVEMVLEVSLPGRPPYQVERSELVPRVALGRLTDGRPVRVVVAPADPDRLVIDWLAQPSGIPAV
jgi:hypothetical protein